ncbi:hypothetical protein BDA99DRAFT_529494 [Phascolomyces articulosus]|uniref:Zn(2)-C6 fungal-type domain-containing protein n=1 Tax=Phascolomyces articulosus TaxID=60185 RepID=A0AAD5JLQ9_9FUNG|nr:hypothetical protein BDA99DRAFT_529494 [Phascolomyces articulosus]
MTQSSLPLSNTKQPFHHHPYGSNDTTYFSNGQQQQSPENRSHCMFKTHLCNDPMHCRYCTSQSQQHGSNSNPTNSNNDHVVNNKPWRIAFFQDDRTEQQQQQQHQYYQQDILARSSTKSSTLHQQNNTHAVPRRLSSGSACETCRRRKTKCDGGQPCAYCATNRIPCLHRASKKRSAHHLNNNKQTALMMGWTTPMETHSSKSNHVPVSHHLHHTTTTKMTTATAVTTAAAIAAAEEEKQRLQWMEPFTRKVERPLSAMDMDHHEPKSIMKQASCPSLMVTQWPQQPRGSTSPIKSLSPPSPLSDHHSTSSDKVTTSTMQSTFADHVTKETMPSVMDQLSCRTFSAVTLAAVDQSPSYPIYPLVAGATPQEHNIRRGYASD